MVERFFVGDRVKTKRGIGLVHEVTTWRDVVVGLHDYEVPDFCAKCKLSVGFNFREDWVQLKIAIGKAIVIEQAKDVELLEGRDAEDGASRLDIISSKEGEGKDR